MYWSIRKIFISFNGQMGEVKPTCIVNVIWELEKAVLCTDQTFWADVLLYSLFGFHQISSCHNDVPAAWNTLNTVFLMVSWDVCLKMRRIKARFPCWFLISACIGCSISICDFRKQKCFLPRVSDLDFSSAIRQLNKQEILQQHMENVLKFGVLLFGGFLC